MNDDKKKQQDEQKNREKYFGRPLMYRSSKPEI